jgi:hypothetical protein
MESTSFYITLPSNASMDIYPNNMKSNFQVRLPRTLYLNSRYEVALSEMQFPVSWKTFNKETSYVIYIKNMEIDEKHMVMLPFSHFDNIHELLHSINETIKRGIARKEWSGIPHFYCNEVKQRIRIRMPENIAVFFSDEMCELLGLPQQTWFKNFFPATREYDVSRGFHSLYVYCNVCQPQIVGDVYAPLLRSVSNIGRRGEHVTKSFTDPHYIAVTDRQVDVIEINIRNDTGELVPFTSGKVVCKLHFRQRTL